MVSANGVLEGSSGAIGAGVLFFQRCSDGVFGQKCTAIRKEGRCFDGMEVDKVCDRGRTKDVGSLKETLIQKCHRRRDSRGKQPGSLTSRLSLPDGLPTGHLRSPRECRQPIRRR